MNQQSSQLGIVLATALGTAPCPSQAEAPRKNPAEIALGFRKRQSEHFAFTYDVAEDWLEARMGEFERTYAAVVSRGQAWGFTLEHATQRIPVVVFNSRDDYDQFSSELGLDARGTAGFCSPGRDMILLFRHERDEATELVLRHEVAHRVLYRLGVHTRGVVHPPWLVEGLACQFEVQQPPWGELRPNPWRLADLRGAPDDAPPGQERPLPREIVGDADFSDSPGEAQPLLYAHAWALVYFLTNRSPREFERYLHRSSMRPAGEPASSAREVADFQAAFGPLDEAFVERWQAFLGGIRCDPPQK